MKNRDYIKMFGEDCDFDSSVDCADCEFEQRCRKEIEESHGIEIDEIGE